MEQAETDDKANIIEHVNIPDTSYICTLWEVYVHTYIYVCSYKVLSALDALQCRSVALAIYRRRCTARKDTADGVGYERGCYGIGYGL